VQSAKPLMLKVRTWLFVGTVAIVTVLSLAPGRWVSAFQAQTIPGTIPGSPYLVYLPLVRSSGLPALPYEIYVPLIAQ
jgi:hypothetical protein